MSSSAPFMKCSRVRELHRWLIAVALVGAGGCTLDWVEVEPEEPWIVATVTVVVTVDPEDPSRADTDVLAWVTGTGAGTDEPHAQVRVSGESGRTLQLARASDPTSTCRTEVMSRLKIRGSCYTASVPSRYFRPHEQLSLEVRTPDGRVVRGVSTMPGAFAPGRVSLQAGACRVDPDTRYRIDLRDVVGGSAIVAEAVFGGLGRDLWDGPGPLYLKTSVEATPWIWGLEFPRDLILEGVEQNARKAARALETGLPRGVTADLAVALVDRNWALWIREGRFHLDGRVPVPSVFGDGTGMFGTAVRWKVRMESREVGEDTGLPDCGLQSVNWSSAGLLTWSP